MTKYFLTSLFICVFTLSSFTYNTEFSASDFGTTNKNLEEWNSVYQSIYFGSNALSESAFKYAYNGYIKLKNAGKLRKDNILSVIDYSLSSNQKRLWVIDLNTRLVQFNEWVSHGKYSGSEFATNFSNRVGSKRTSLGFFITGKTYNGKHRYSLKLHGLDAGYNNNAFKRGIVMHGADYVSERFIYDNSMIGRSYGCPAIRQAVKYDLINMIKDGSCVFAYYPSAGYLNNSRFLR